MMRMLWVMMGMFVPFVAPSLTLKRCACVTSVNCNIVRIALTHTHCVDCESLTPTRGATQQSVDSKIVRFPQ